MIDLDKIHSLSDFQRNTKKHLRRLKKTGRPEVLTVNGQAEVIVQSAAGYQELLEAAELAETLPILKKSLEESRRGEGIPAEEVFAEIRRKLGIKDRA
ncbi:MAG TPA: type II toxin-antitoxin system Phd/YefM family antitoxin [Tepidisphaeraceae bacterium]